MESERSLLRAMMEDEREEGMFTRGRIGGREVVLMQSGIGKVNAAWGTVMMVEGYRPDCVVSTGCAGGVDAGLGVMDVVVGREVMYHDVWCGPGNAIGQVQGMPREFVGDEHLVSVAERLNADADHGARVLCGLICTGDRFITDPAELRRIKTSFPLCLAVDMESAAIAQVCHIMEVPFVSFRVVSDTPGCDRHFEQYTNFWGEMAARSFEITKRFIANI